MEELNIAMEALVSQKPLVGYWMNWMSFVLFASFLFAYWKKPARWVVLSLPIMMGIAFLVYSQTNNIHLLGVAHLLVWPFLTYYLIKSVLLKKDFKAKSLCGIWVILLVLTMMVSMLFDVRDIVLVLMDMKG